MPDTIAPTRSDGGLRLWKAALAGACAIFFGSAGAAAADQDVGACHLGVYRLADGSLLDIGLSDGGLRWRNFEGETGKLVAGEDGWIHTRGWTDDSDRRQVSFGDCEQGLIEFDGTRGSRVPLNVQETTFVSHGVELAGRLILPDSAGPVPIVVLLQGSERDSARDFDPLQRLLPAAGVGAFVFDKRGVGASEGVYTQDFSLLADDAVAALQETRRLAGARAGRIGFQGPSQGGWVAPIAASRAPVDFVIVSFGLAVSVLDEDLEAIRFQMALKGHDEASIAQAIEIAHGAARVFESGFTEGVPELEALRDRYRDEPWYRDVHGNFTGVILGLSSEELRTLGPQFRWGTSFRYDPRPTLASLDTPQLWALGGQDIDAPVGETVRRLEHLIAQGRPITLAVYPMAEHGLTEFEVNAEGSRVSTRYATGYFRMLRDFARDGAICPPHVVAVVRLPAQSDCAAAPEVR